jgi:hypothetical protein
MVANYPTPGRRCFAEWLCNICHMTEGFAIIFWLAVIGLWVLGSYSRARVARTLGKGETWRSYVPLLHLELEFEMGKVPQAAWLLLFVGLIWVASISAWSNALYALGRSRWFALVLWIPLLGAVPMAYVAFTQEDFQPSPAAVQA